MVENAKVDKFKGNIGDLQLILNLFFFLGVKMVVIIILRVGYGSWILYSIVRMQNGISSSSRASGVCFMLRGALNVRFTTLLFHIGPYFRSYWRYPSSKKL